MYRESTKLPAQVGGEQILKVTGKTFENWTDLLDAKNIKSLNKSQLHSTLINEYQLAPEWASIIASFYLEHHEIVEPQASLTFDVSATRTYSIALHVLEEYFTDEALRLSWMALPLTAIKTQTGRSIRYKGLDEGVLLATFNGKSAEKCQVTLQHLKLANEETAGKMQKFWKERLVALAKVLGIS
jgi:hypothetical protein